ncbi:MAG: JAB domain-containing protein [Chloroflexota bacterium]
MRFVPTLRDPTPSPDDIHITKAIIEAGHLLDIQVLDRAP